MRHFPAQTPERPRNLENSRERRAAKVRGFERPSITPRRLPVLLHLKTCFASWVLLVHSKHSPGFRNGRGRSNHPRPGYVLLTYRERRKFSRSCLSPTLSRSKLLITVLASE